MGQFVLPPPPWQDVVIATCHLWVPEGEKLVGMVMFALRAKGVVDDWNVLNLPRMAINAQAVLIV